MRGVAVKPGQKGSVGLVDLPEPHIKRSEVLVKTLAVGIDGTDIEINHGSYGEPPENEDFLVLGHEAVGQVVEIGVDVGEIGVGDLVVPTVRRPCQDCQPCRQGLSDDCQSGRYTERGIKGSHGYLSDLFTESPENLLRLPENLESLGVLIEPASVAQKAAAQAFKIQQRLKWRPGRILVLGAGPLGLLVTLSLRLQDIDVLTYDLAPSDSLKGLISAEMGSRYVEAGQTTLEALAVRHGRPDMIFEVTGSSKVAFSAANILNDDGVMCLLSVAARDHATKICLSCFNNQLVLGNRAMFGSVSSNRSHFESAIKMAASAEKIWPGLMDQIITDYFDLEEYRKAINSGANSRIKSAIRIN